LFFFQFFQHKDRFFSPFWPSATTPLISPIAGGFFAFPFLHRPASLLFISKKADAHLRGIFWRRFFEIAFYFPFFLFFLGHKRPNHPFFLPSSPSLSSSCDFPPSLLEGNLRLGSTFFLSPPSLLLLGLPPDQFLNGSTDPSSDFSFLPLLVPACFRVWMSVAL